MITPLSNLTPTQIRQKAHDLLKVNENLVEHVLFGGSVRWGVLTKIILGKTNQHLKHGIILPQTKYQRVRIIRFPRKRGNSAR